ncbi:MAG: RdgB/HAM1 family non-canonical purine NTP pyrophosphatase [Oscillospiraceae bacterium]|nr:RdgB/HAM1 family non-canonical purine NTP pyrophosphatase [Oscillospiraceae bacterium]
MDILIATKNQKKKLELQRILAPLGLSVVTEEDRGFALSDVEETGLTFEENARLKAVSGCEESGLPCVGDDSGLCVDALGGAPGIYSARFAGEHGNDEANTGKLLELLAGLPREARGARFVCAICCRFPDGSEIMARGECEGHIGFAPAGSGGFGYDPVFIPNGFMHTMAQLSFEEKDAVSHRGRALTLLAKKWEERLSAR